MYFYIILGLGTLLRPRQLRLNVQHVRLALDLNHAVHLGRVAHQLDRAGVHHPGRRVAVFGEVVEEDVRDSETAGGLCGSISTDWLNSKKEITAAGLTVD